jgi:glycosyltransferase involved in cell wall biosynthesis
MANRLVAWGHQVTVITFEGAAAVAGYRLNPQVRHERLGDIRRFSLFPFQRLNQAFGFIAACIRLRKVLKKLENDRPAIILGFLPHMSFYGRAASLGLNFKMIPSERMHPAFEFTRKSKAQTLVRFITYCLADGIHVQTQDAKLFFPKWLQRKIRVIPNAISNLERGSRAVDVPRPFLLSVGRLVPQKRFDILIAAFSRVARDFREWALVILGEGPLRENLETQIYEQGVGGRVFLLGETADLLSFYEEAEFLVLCSDYEGFPNVLLEAMSVGLPVISTDCPSGPKEIIENGRDGILIPMNNLDALEGALRRLMKSNADRKSMGAAAKKNIQRFQWEELGGLWIDWFRALTK